MYRVCSFLSAISTLVAYVSMVEMITLLYVCFYQFAGFDPFERSTYFGPFFDLGQVRKIFSLRSCVDRYIITCIPYSFKSFLTLLGFLKFVNVVWTLSTNISPFDLPGLAWSQGKENLEQFVGWRGWSISHLSESLCVQSDFSSNILDRWIFSVRLCSMPKQFTLPCYFMAHMHPKRTDLSKEYGYKALARRRKRYFNLQWFRFGFALPCLHWWYLIKLIWLLHWLTEDRWFLGWLLVNRELASWWRWIFRWGCLLGSGMSISLLHYHIYILSCIFSKIRILCIFYVNKLCKATLCISWVCKFFLQISLSVWKLNLICWRRVKVVVCYSAQVLFCSSFIVLLKEKNKKWGVLENLYSNFRAGVTYCHSSVIEGLFFPLLCIYLGFETKLISLFVSTTAGGCDATLCNGTLAFFLGKESFDGLGSHPSVSIIIFQFRIDWPFTTSSITSIVHDVCNTYLVLIDLFSLCNFLLYIFSTLGLDNLH